MAEPHARHLRALPVGALPAGALPAGALDPARLPRDTVPARTVARRLDLARTPLPPVRRPDAFAVLDVTEFFGEGSGGVRTYLERKAAYVAGEPGLRHVLVVPGPADAIDDGPGTRRYALAGPAVPMQAPYRFMLAVRQPRRIVEHERPHVVEVGSPGLAPWIVRVATRRLGIPCVYFWHSDYPRQLAGVRGERPRLGALAWHYARQLDRHFACTIVATDVVRRALVAQGIDRVAQVPLGVDVDTFHPARRADAAHVRALVGLPAERPVVLYVGRFAREKSLDVLLDAWARVRRRTGAHLALLGAGPDAARLRAHPEAAHVSWLPYVADRRALADVMAAADVLVAPGPIETFGLAALEAMACGTPVVAVDGSGAGELVGAAGAGRCVAPDDAPALADAVVALLDGGAADRHALGRAGRVYAEATHAWPRVLGRLFALHADVARGAWTSGTRHA